MAEDNISIIYAPTSYLEGDKMTGYNLILEALVDNVVEEPAQSMSRTVNIFGIMADMSNANADALEMKRLLGELGIKVNEVFCCNSEIDRIKHAAEANLNIVVSEIRGVGAAKKMEQRLGVPYKVVPYPIGMTNTKNFLQTAADFFGINKKKVDELIARESETVYEAMRKAMFWAAEYRGCPLVGSTAAIVGESTVALGVTRYLVEEWGVKPLLLVMKTYNDESLELLSEMQKELGIKPQVLLNPGHDAIRQAFRETKPLLILGGNYEKADVREMGLDRSAGTVFIHIATFPCGVDTAGRFDIYPHPFAGFQGVIYLTEVILNEMVRQSFEQVWAAFPATPSTT